MKAKISLKTLYRSPVRTVLTFILLAAVTFALFSQILEYSVAKREMEKMVALYDGVINVESGIFDMEGNELPAYMYRDKRVPQGIMPDETMEEYRKLGFEPMTAEEIETLSALPYVTYTDTRYMTAGVTEFRRIDEGTMYYDYTNICVVEGTVRFYNATQRALAVTDLELVGGEPIKNSGFGKHDVWIHAEPSYVLENTTMPVFYWVVNNRAVMVATQNSVYTPEYLESLNEGERYLFVLRYEDDLMITPDTYTYYLTDPFIYGQCDAVYPLKDEPDNYIETEKFAPVRRYIERLEADMHTFDVVYTGDMGSIRYFSDGTVGVSEGRMIDKEDTENKNNVCVINHSVALEYGLSVGDTITVDLGNKLFNANRAVGAVSAVKERASTEYTTAELEIVGIFKDTRNKYLVLRGRDVAWGYGVNTIFVPQHLLNVDETEYENHEFHYGEVSFVVEDAWNIPAFKKDVIPQIEDMGYTLYWEDGNFEELILPIKETERIAIIKISVLLFAIVVVTWFISMLYIVGRRKDYAVMRLLGTTKAKSAKALVLPLGVIAIVAVAVGSAAAYGYTAHNITESKFLEVVSGIDVDLSIPLWVLAVCILGEILLTLVLSLMLLGVIGRKSPLELMQAGTKRRKIRKRKKTVVSEPASPVALQEWTSIERLVPDGKNRSMSFTMRYVWRHIRRTLGKAMLFILVAVLLINVLGQLVIMRNSYISVFEGTEIMSDFAGFMNLGYIGKLQQSEYVKDVYYCHNKLLSVNRSKSYDLRVTFCNNLDLYAEYNGIKGLEVTWLEGYDETSVQKLGNVVIIGEEYLREHDLEIGDTVEIARFLYYNDCADYYIRLYTSSVMYNGESGEEIMELFGDRIYKDYSRKMEEFLIVGSMEDDEGLYDEVILTPGSPGMSIDFGTLMIPPTVSAVLADNWKAEGYREYAIELTKENRAAEIAFIMDTSKIENVRNNIELMNTLYPIMIAAVMVIGAFLCGMLIVQNSKDIAIMRVLGTSKRRVRAIMVLEHIILCIIGVILAAVVLFIRGVFAQMLWVTVLYVVVILAASYVASVLASRKNVLELLQTKE